jgi:hypothetical protein
MRAHVLPTACFELLREKLIPMNFGQTKCANCTISLGYCTCLFQMLSECGCLEDPISTRPREIKLADVFKRLNHLIIHTSLNPPKKTQDTDTHKPLQIRIHLHIHIQAEDPTSNYLLHIHPQYPNPLFGSSHSDEKKNNSVMTIASVTRMRVRAKPCPDAGLPCIC